MIKIKFEKVLEINSAINKKFLDPTFENTKFGYACKKFIKKNLLKSFQEFDDENEVLKIEHALIDEKTKEILRDEKGNYKFSKEETLVLMNLRKSLVEKWNDKEIEVEPYIVSDLPDLTEEEKELFKDIFY